MTVDRPEHDEVWPCEPPDDSLRPRPRGSRRACTHSAVMLGVAAVLAFVFGHPIPALAVCALSAFVLISGLWLPRVFGAVESAGQRLAAAVSLGLTWGLLVPFYYVCFVPGALLLRMRRKDPMFRRYDSKSPSYWVHRPPVDSTEHFRRQY